MRACLFAWKLPPISMEIDHTTITSVNGIPCKKLMEAILKPAGIPWSGCDVCAVCVLATCHKIMPLRCQVARSSCCISCSEARTVDDAVEARQISTGPLL